MRKILLLMLAGAPCLHAADTNAPAGRLPATPPVGITNASTNSISSSREEIVVTQGIKIWKKGTPTNAFTTIGFETLMRQRGFANAQSNIARGVLARKGNAAIVTSIINSQRLNFDLNTQDERLDGIDVRYQIILLKP